MNLGQIRDYARNLTGVYSDDLVSDDLLTGWVNEAYDEIATSRVWPWLESKYTLVEDGDEPVFDEIFHPMLAYRASVKVLAHQADDTQRSEYFTNEFTILYQRMAELYLPAIAPGTNSTLEELRWMVRDLVGAYEFGVSDGMITNFLNQAYNEVARARPWPWLENTIEVSLQPGENEIELPDGARRVLDVFRVGDNVINPVISVPHLMDVDQWEDTLRYDVAYDGTMTVAPTPTSPTTLRIRYLVRNVSLSEEYGPAFDEQFNPILAYIAALKVIGVFGTGRANPEALSAQVSEMLNGMVSEYIIDHSERPIQMGGIGDFSDKFSARMRFI